MRRIAMAACILVAACGTGALQAQALYICATSTGNSYQQIPCSAPARLVGTLLTSPEPQPTAEMLARRMKQAEQDRAESAFLAHQAGTDGTGLRPVRGAHRSSAARSRWYAARAGSRVADACGTARNDRKRVLQEVGLGRTLELMRRLDAAVWAACAH
ncbi:hypothetical protein [Cognatiluteimonas telluris]|uniref:hypothetical protein n=1 Tax=Cognatiluteimonas telluris TaxID=1104775 RepID=UPI001407D29D|nr:hypothetical protein [Lysobacter telluris]